MSQEFISYFMVISGLALLVVQYHKFMEAKGRRGGIFDNDEDEDDVCDDIENAIGLCLFGASIFVVGLVLLS